MSAGGIQVDNRGRRFDLSETRESISTTIRQQIDQARQLNRQRVVRDVISNLDQNEIGIAFLDVGQGNCAVVRLPTGETIVIDCNIKEANVDIVKFLKSCGVEKVDILVITHPHTDHMSGLGDIAANFSVGRVWISPFERDVTNLPPESKQEYEKFLRTINIMERKGVPIENPMASSKPYAHIGDVDIRVLSPSKDAPMEGEQQIHEASIVMDVRIGKFSALFGGDLNEKGWDALAEKYNVKSTILNASHHGSDVGCNEKVVRRISPDYTVVSVGENMFGHPHEDAVKTYRDCSNKDVLFTDEGSVGFRGKKDGTTRVVQ